MEIIVPYSNSKHLGADLIVDKCPVVTPAAKRKGGIVKKQKEMMPGNTVVGDPRRNVLCPSVLGISFSQAGSMR